MTTWVGSQARLAFGRETTFGVRATPSRFLGITNSGWEGLDKTLNVNAYRNIGSGRRFFTTIAGRREYGPKTLNFLPTTGELFYYIFGTDSFTGGSPNVHLCFPVASATMPSMTLSSALEGSPNMQRTAVGTVVDGATFSLTEGGELTCAMDLTARDLIEWDVSSPTLLTQPAGTNQRPYMFYDRAASVSIMGTYDYSANTMSGARTIAQVKGFNCSIRSNLRPQYFSNSADTTTLTGTVSTTNGSATVTGTGTAFDTQLYQGARIRIGTATATTYTVANVASSTSLTLTENYTATAAGQTAYRVNAEPQDPSAFTTGFPDFDLTIDIVPRGKRGGSPASGNTGTDTDALMDLLEDEIRGDILIPFQRSSTDRLDFVFDDCMIRRADHPIPEDGNEVVVRCEVQPSEFRVVVRDSIAAYSGL